MNNSIAVFLVAVALITGNTQAAPKKAEAGFQITGQIFIVTKGQQTFKLPLVQVFAVPEADISRVLAARVAVRNEIRRNITPALIEKKLAADQAKAEFKPFGEASKEASSAVVEAMGVCKAMGGMAFVNCMNGSNIAALKTRSDAARTEGKLPLERSQAAHQQYKELAIEYKNQRDAAKFVEGIESDISAVAKVIKTDADGNFTIDVTKGKRIAIFARAKRQVVGETEDYAWLIWVTPANAKRLMLSNDNLLDTQCGECVDFRKGIEFDAEVANGIHVLYPEFPADRP